MKRAVLILLLGLAGAVAAYCAIYFAGSASSRELEESRAPELAWLQKEFGLSDTELKRISERHVAYQPHCKEMRRRIDEQNAHLKRLAAATNEVTREIEQAMAESAVLRVECQKSMLKHFYEVSRSMPPEQSKRYLQWVQEKTFLPTYGMSGDGAR